MTNTSAATFEQQKDEGVGLFGLFRSTPRCQRHARRATALVDFAARAAGLDTRARRLGGLSPRGSISKTGTTTDSPSPEALRRIPALGGKRALRQRPLTRALTTFAVATRNFR